MSDSNCGETRLVSLKVLYTLHGVESQKFVVKPASQVEARVFDSSDLGIVSLRPCLDAIRHSSPDYAEICDSSANDYAIYSVDYAEDGLPLQGHGRVSEHVLKEVTGKLRHSKFLHEQLELQIHLLPIRIPPELPFDVPPEHNEFGLSHSLVSPHLPQSLPRPNNEETLQDKEGAAQQRHAMSASKAMFQFPSAPPSLNFDMHFPSIPGLPGSLQTSRSDAFLPSSPPVRAKPTKISPSSGAVAPKRPNPADTTPAKRSTSESTSSGSKKKKQSSPGSSADGACGNCGVATASTWRRVHLDGGDILLCNACGLYYKTKNIMRPSFLWDRSNRLAHRGQEPAVAKAAPTKSSSGRRASPTASGSASLGSSSDLNPQPTTDPLSQDTTDTSSPEAARDPEIKTLRLPLSLEGNHNVKFEEVEEPQHPLQLHLPEAPSTPPRGNRPEEGESQQVPSSIEKLFLVTPDGRKTINIHLPGSGSAGKWLNRMMNPAEESSYFESFLASPTPKKNRTAYRPSDSPICSSPPTSSTLFSEIPDWSVFPTSPTPPKALALSDRQKHEGEYQERQNTHNTPSEAI